MLKKVHADRIRAYIRDRYLEPAKLRGEQVVTLRAGDIARELGISDRVPAVCSALRSRQLRQANAIEIIDRSGPPSGQSPTVTFTYRFKESGGLSTASLDSFLALRGAGKDVYASFGGGEAYLKAERAAWED